MMRHSGAKRALNRQIWLTVLILALHGCASVSDAVPDVVPDDRLRAEVARLVESDERIPTAVEIRVSEGIVDIAGVVPSTGDVRYILRRVGSVAGVRGVVNRLRVVR